MLAIPATQGTRTMLVTLKRGDDLIESLHELLAGEGIHTGLIVGGIGSFEVLRMHTITGTTLPIGERFIEAEGPIEIGSLQGSVAAGEPHLHAVVHDTAADQTHIGHIEPGCIVLWRVELGLIAFDGVRTVNELNYDTGLVDLRPLGEE